MLVYDKIIGIGKWIGISFGVHDYEKYRTFD